MKKSEQIFEDAIKKAEKEEMPYPRYSATGALKAKYDMLRDDYLELKKQYDDTKRKS